MRLTIALLGFELDLTLGRTSTDEAADIWIDCGTTVSYPVGFVRPEIPWDADTPVHSFDPAEGDEDA